MGAWYVATTGIVAGTSAPAPGEAGAFVPAMIAGLFAYGGWHMVTYAAGETRDAARTIPRALFIGTTVVTVAYIAINASYLAVLPIEAVTSSNRVAADFADAVLGSGGADALAALVVISALGGMTGIILAGPRVYLAMADDGLLFRWAASLHQRYRTPHVAIALQAAWSSVLVLTGTYRALFTRVVYTEWIFFALMAVSILFLRRRQGYAPAYRLPAAGVLVVIFATSSAVIVLNQIVREPLESMTGLGLVLAGLPVYWMWKRRSRVDS
jgi:APA family basic amino acid/polyamine antiporter